MWPGVLYNNGGGSGGFEGEYAVTKSSCSIVMMDEECSNDWGGEDTTILSPGRSPKQPRPGIGLHDPLHSRQACPEFNSFHQGVRKKNPREELFSCRPFPKRGKNCDISAPAPQPLNDSKTNNINAKTREPPRTATPTLTAAKIPFKYFRAKRATTYCDPTLSAARIPVKCIRAKRATTHCDPTLTAAQIPHVGVLGSRYWAVIW